MSLCQDNYIDKLINKFNINTCSKLLKASLIHYVQIIKNKKTVAKQKIRTYQQEIESINFAIIIICLNVILTALKLLEFFINLLTYYMKQIDKMLRYLTHTKNYVIVFNDQTNNLNIMIIKFSDALFADDSNISQNFNKYCFKLFDEMID